MFQVIPKEIMKTTIKTSAAVILLLIITQIQFDVVFCDETPKTKVYISRINLLLLLTSLLLGFYLQLKVLSRHPFFAITKQFESSALELIRSTREALKEPSKKSPDKKKDYYEALWKHLMGYFNKNEK